MPDPARYTPPPAPTPPAPPLPPLPERLPAHVRAEHVAAIRGACMGATAVLAGGTFAVSQGWLTGIGAVVWLLLLVAPAVSVWANWRPLWLDDQARAAAVEGHWRYLEWVEGNAKHMQAEHTRYGQRFYPRRRRPQKPDGPPVRDQYGREWRDGRPVMPPREVIDQQPVASARVAPPVPPAPPPPAPAADLETGVLTDWTPPAPVNPYAPLVRVPPVPPAPIGAMPRLAYTADMERLMAFYVQHGTIAWRAVAAARWGWSQEYWKAVCDALVEAGVFLEPPTQGSKYRLAARYAPYVASGDPEAVHEAIREDLR